MTMVMYPSIRTVMELRLKYITYFLTFITKQNRLHFFYKLYKLGQLLNYDFWFPDSATE